MHVPDCVALVQTGPGSQGKAIRAPGRLPTPALLPVLALMLMLAGCQAPMPKADAVPGLTRVQTPSGQIPIPASGEPAAATVLPQAGDALGPKDSGVSLEELNRQADAGDPLAQIRMGLRYAKGRGLPQDDEQAFLWYARAAERKVPLAQFLVAEAWFHGRGVRQDDEEALHWFQQSADQGFTRAQLMLGTMYALGRGTPADSSRAVIWYEQAARWGEADAQYLLGRAYREGEGVDQDDAQALNWFMMAARQGHTDAQVMVGVSYQKGRGVEKDYRKAAVFYGAAAEDGSAVGTLMLGLLYEAGAGVQQDLVIAFALAELAVIRAPDTEKIAEIRDRLQRRLAPDQIAEGQAVALRMGEPGQFFSTLTQVARSTPSPRRQI